MDELPTVPPSLFTFSSVLVGYLLIGDLNSLEQNALGNWLVTAGQMLLTNGSYEQVLDAKEIANKQVDGIASLEKLVRALQKEIEELKKQI